MYMPQSAIDTPKDAASRNTSLHQACTYILGVCICCVKRKESYDRPRLLFAHVAGFITQPMPGLLIVRAASGFGFASRKLAAYVKHACVAYLISGSHRKFSKPPACSHQLPATTIVGSKQIRSQPRPDPVTLRRLSL